MPPDQDSLLISLKPDASRCDSNSIEPATRQVETENDTGTDRPGNLELGRGTSAVYLGTTRGDNAARRHGRTPGRPHRAPRAHRRAVRDLRAYDRTEIHLNGISQAPLQERGRHQFAARSFVRAVKTLRSPYLTNIGIVILLYAISLHPCFDLASVVSRSFVCLGAKAAFVASVDLVVDEWTPAIQAFLAGRLVRWIGLSLLLALLPALTVIRMGMLAKLRSLAAIALVRLRGAQGAYRQRAKKSTPPPG
jgi:hypothetical protein